MKKRKKNKNRQDNYFNPEDFSDPVLSSSKGWVSVAAELCRNRSESHLSCLMKSMIRKQSSKASVSSGSQLFQPQLPHERDASSEKGQPGPEEKLSLTLSL